MKSRRNGQWFPSQDSFEKKVRQNRHVCMRAYPFNSRRTILTRVFTFCISLQSFNNNCIVSQTWRPLDGTHFCFLFVLLFLEQLSQLGVCLLDSETWQCAVMRATCHHQHKGGEGFLTADLISIQGISLLASHLHKSVKLKFDWLIEWIYLLLSCSKAASRWRHKRKMVALSGCCSSSAIDTISIWNSLKVSNFLTNFTSRGKIHFFDGRFRRVWLGAGFVRRMNSGRMKRHTGVDRGTERIQRRGSWSTDAKRFIAGRRLPVRFPDRGDTWQRR